MKLEEIQQHWERDSTVDRTELGEESLRIPQLHSKYFKFFSAERLLLRKMEYEYKSLHKEKYEYTDIRNASLKIKMQEEKVEFLESILKSLPNRGYQIAQAIAWEKFKVGA